MNRLPDEAPAYMSDPELKTTLRTRARRGFPRGQVACRLDLTEGAVR